MNLKILLAFLGGAVLASGIVYMAVKPDSKPVAKTLYVEPAPETPAPAQAVTPAKPPAAAPAEQKSPVVSEMSPPHPRHETARVERHRAAAKEKPVEIARVTKPVNPPAAETPAPAPVTTAPAPVTPAPPAQTEPVQTVTTPPPPAPEPPKPEPPQPHVVTLAAGTPLSVRIGETISTKRNKPGDTFLATLAQPLVIDGFVIAERGSRCEGRVVEADPGGRVRGTARITVELTSLHTSDGQRIRIRTASFAQDAQASRREDAAKVGGGAALGAIIGAIAGGGKGAGIGAAAGGAAGAGDVMLTRGKPAEIRVETQVSFRVQDPVMITERLD